MAQWKDVGRRVGKRAGAVHGAAGTVIERLEQRMLLAGTPVVDWSTYLGNGSEIGRGIAIDGSGNAWVAGQTQSTDFASGGFDTTYNGGIADGFVAKINANGTLAWSSYLGGSGSEGISAVAIDGNGNAWVAGVTTSTDLARGGFDNTYHGGSFATGGNCDAFVAKINADGTLAWVSYLGGNGADEEPSIAIDGQGNAWVTGMTGSTDLATGGFETTYNGGGRDGFVAKINADGTLAWSSYLGGDNHDGAAAIAIDASGNAWVTGGTGSSGWISGGFDTSFNGGSEGFVAKINADGTLAWSSYLFPDDRDFGNAIAIDRAGNAWVAGLFGHLAKINADGTLAWVNNDHQGIVPQCRGIALDTTGNAWVAGDDLRSPSGSDAYVARFNSAGALTWLYYLGPKQVAGVFADVGWALAIDANDRVWVTGDTYKSGWTSGGFDTTYDGGAEAFVVKIRMPSPPVAYDQALTTSRNVAIDGTMIADDPDADPLTYSVVSQPTNGTLSFTPDGAFIYTPNSNYEGADSFTFKANDGAFDSNIATIGITIAHDLQANISLSPSSILENQPSGTVVGAFSVSGPDAIAPFTYALVSGAGAANNASFTIAGDQLLSAAVFDYEAKNSYSIRVRLIDSTNQTFEQAFTISVMNVNEAPTNLRLSNAVVPENQPPGLFVGTLITTDPDRADTFTYSLVDGDGSDDNASFTITGSHLLTAASFSLADRSSYSIRVRTTDAGGLSFEKAFTISVVDTILDNASIPRTSPPAPWLAPSPAPIPICPILSAMNWWMAKALPTTAVLSLMATNF